ncbi:unnamed protein product [Caenorhabditis brenneri]
MLLFILLMLNLSYFCDGKPSVGMAGVQTTPTFRIGIDYKPLAPFTEMQFDGTFSCPLNTTWCLTGYIEEDDNFSNNEYMFRFQFFCSDNDSYSYNVPVNFTGGDGFIDNAYDPAIEMFHNCTSNGIVRQVFQRFEEVKGSLTSFQITYDQDLLDYGTKEKFEEDYGDVTKKWEPEVYDWIYKGKRIVSSKFLSDIRFEDTLLYKFLCVPYLPLNSTRTNSC